MAPHTVQIALFVTSAAKAGEIAESVFPGIPVASSMSQNEISVAELAGDPPTRISCTPGRIDFVWEPRATPRAIAEGSVSVEALAESFASIAQFASSLAVTRVAAILTERERVDSAQEAVNRTREQLGGVEIPDNATEFTYRLNVPSPVEGFTMNRIVTWQAAKIGFIGITINAGGGLPGGLPEQVFYDVWERIIDVNTVQESPLEVGSAQEALERVIQEAMRLAEKGFTAI